MLKFSLSSYFYEFFDWKQSLGKVNHPDYVDMAFEATGWSRDWLIDGISAPVQLPLRLETLMRKHFDLIGIPKRHFFAILALYSNHELEKERLTEFAASDGTDERWDYANRPRRSLAEALMDFPNTVKSFPIEAIFELFPLIRPRPYSICSHSESYVEILCAVVKYRSRMGEFSYSNILKFCSSQATNRNLLKLCEKFKSWRRGCYPRDWWHFQTPASWRFDHDRTRDWDG